MRYTSPFEDDSLMKELMNDLSGLAVGSSFLLKTPEEKRELLEQCDKEALRVFRALEESNQPATVDCITLKTDKVIGFDSLRRTSDLEEDAVITQIYRYFDTPREAIVSACIAAPSEMKKTKEVTFFCGPDRRKTGNFRIFSLHPGPRRQVFPNRYQPEAIRKENQAYWDRHVFLATPNQIIHARNSMRQNIREMEEEARIRVVHMTRNIDGALHHWYGTWENYKPVSILLGQKEDLQEVGDFAMNNDHTVVYYTSKPGQPPPDFNNSEETESRLSNEKRPSKLALDATEEYFLNGRRHRDGAPAVIRPLADGGWEEIWYEEGLVSRLPDQGPARIIYNRNGEIDREISIYKGSEVEETTLGAAAEPVKALQAKIHDTLLSFKWFEEVQDFQLLRGQLELAANRNQCTVADIVRQMQQQHEQVGLRWDFDRTLEQDAYCRENYQRLLVNVAEVGVLLLEASRAMRSVEGNASIIGAIWGKVHRDMERLIARGSSIPGEPGKTVVDDLRQTERESKKFYQTLTEQNAMFNAVKSTESRT